MAHSAKGDFINQILSLLPFIVFSQILTRKTIKYRFSRGKIRKSFLLFGKKTANGG